jgi:hypothetical protein
MKRISLAVLLFICFSLIQELNAQTIQVGNLQVSNQDLPGYYTVSQAFVNLSQNKDWRLPTIEELHLIYSNRSSVGGLKYGADAYLASGNQNNFKIPNSQAEYGNASFWALEFGTGRWVQPSTSTQLCIRLVKKESTQSPSVTQQKTATPKVRKSSKRYSGDCITTYSASYGLTGYNLDQPEVQFNLETTYLQNSRFTQLYRWRYAMGEFKGLIFEYNNRIYFGKNRDYDNSKWFLQGKVGYGLLKGQDYGVGTLFYMDNNTLQPIFNTTPIIDSRRMSFNYGLSLGYKWIIKDRLTFDVSTGYVGFSKPNFTVDSPFEDNLRIKDWTNGIGAPIEFQWSIGFFLD